MQNKTELCQFFQNWTGCKYTTDQCKYLHITKEQICKFYQTSSCNKGKQCGYYHVKLQASKDIKSCNDEHKTKTNAGCKYSAKEECINSFSKKNQLSCKFYFSQSGCINGKECSFSHIKQQSNGSVEHFKHRSDINCENYQFHRAKEMTLLKGKFPQYKEKEYAKETCITITFKLANYKSIGIQKIPMTIIIPYDYPLKNNIKIDLKLKTGANVLYVAVNEAIQDWLSQEIMNKQKNLMVDSLLNWLKTGLQDVIPYYQDENQFYEDVTSEVSAAYQSQVLRAIKEEFPMLNPYKLEIILSKHNYHYAPSHKGVMNAIEAMGLVLDENKNFIEMNDMENTVIHFIPVFVPNRGYLTLHLNNIAIDAQEEDITDFFETNAIEVINVIKIPGKTFAFVNLNRCDDFEAAMGLNGKCFLGSKIKINMAIDDNKYCGLGSKGLRSQIANDIASIVLRVEILKEKVKSRHNEFTCTDLLLKKEIRFVSKYLKEKYTIVCECCYDEFNINDMIRCPSMHYVCINCLENYASEIIFGQAKFDLKCMGSSDCEKCYSFNLIKRRLPQNVCDSLEERYEEETVNKTNLENLQKYPNCSFPLIMTGDFPILPCQNCFKVWCKHCLREWENTRTKIHSSGLCVKDESEWELNFRKSIEEKMSQLRIRNCPVCKRNYTKEEGCNKITCICGLKMCYLCRSVINDYSHFCQHPRDDFIKCVTACDKCFLFSDPKEDEERMILQLKEEAESMRIVEGFCDFKPIGVLTTEENDKMQNSN